MTETITFLGREISLYYLFWFLGAVAAYCVGLLIRKNYGFSVSKSIIYISGALTFGFVLMWGTSWICGGGRLIGLNYVRVVPFLPLAVLLLAKLMKDPFGEVSDFLFPLSALELSISRIGCIIVGCCHGYPCDWGIYSTAADIVCFPIQIFESITLLLLAILLILFRRFKIQRGKGYAWYLFLFGITRFSWEFLRDNEKIWHGLSELSFHALLAAVIGFLALLIMWLRTRKESKGYEKY